MTVAITDVVLRDAHQSLFATRLRLDDMLPIAAQLDDVGYRSLECLSLIHISEPTRPRFGSRMPSSA